MQVSVECFATGVLLTPILMGHTSRETTRRSSVMYQHFSTYTPGIKLEELLSAHYVVTFFLLCGSKVMQGFLLKGHLVIKFDLNAFT